MAAVEVLQSFDNLAIVDALRSGYHVQQQSPKRRRVNHDPYGGDGFAWEDCDVLISAAAAAAAEATTPDQSKEEQQVVESSGIDGVNQLDSNEMDDLLLDIRPLATQRLDQIQRHLATFAMEVEKSQEQCMGELLSWANPARIWIEGPYTGPPPHRFPSPVHQPVEETAAEEGTVYDQQFVFHCPYIQCHRNIKAQNEVLPASSQQRACVHSDCGFCSKTAKGWQQHVQSAHHDLQPFPDLTPVYHVEDYDDRLEREESLGLLCTAPHQHQL